MKRIFMNAFFAGCALAITTTSFAQAPKKADTDKKDVQQIIITRTGDPEQKNGD